MSFTDTNGAPQIGELHTGDSLLGSHSSARSNGAVDNNSFGKTKNAVFGSAQSAMDTVQNHPVTQNVKDTYNNSPVGQVVNNETAKTSMEFRDLANARTTPNQPAATGQPLTHYHSMFYRLLSWKSPRATAITFAVSVLLIFTARYLNIIRYIFKALYLVLGVTTAAEVAGKVAFGNGITSQIRPKKYFVIPKESLERFLDDAEQLINFFVIEFQRIVFAENVYVTAAAFVASLSCFGLIKLLPLWGLTLLFTSVIYLAPLVYISNKEVIDQQLEKAGVIINRQAAQVKNIATQQTSRATVTMKNYAGEYSAKAQGLMGAAKQKTAAAAGQAKARTASAANAASDSVQSADFPSAPRSEPYADSQASYANRSADSQATYGNRSADSQATYGNRSADSQAGYGNRSADSQAGYGNRSADSQADYANHSADSQAAYMTPVADPQVPYAKPEPNYSY